MSYLTLLGDAASDEFGDTVRSPSLFRSFDLSELPPFPVGIEVHMATFPLTALHGARIAIGWDGGSIWEGQPQAVTSGQIITIPVQAAQGQSLEVWVQSTSILNPDLGEVADCIALPLADAQKRQTDRNPNTPGGIPTWVIPVGLGILGLIAIAPIITPFIAASARLNPRRRRRASRR